MAKRRLNMPVVITLSVVLVLLVAGGFVVLYRFGPKDPGPYIDAARRAEKRALDAAGSDPDKMYDALKEVIRDYSTAAAYDKDNKENRTALMIRQADVRLFLGETQDRGARGSYQSILKSDPKNVQALERRSSLDYLYVRTGRNRQDWKELANQCDILLKIDPNNLIGRRIRAQALIGQADPATVDAALEDLAKLRELASDDPLGYSLAAGVLVAPPGGQEAGTPPPTSQPEKADELMAYLPKDAGPAVRSRFRLYQSRYALLAKKDEDEARKLAEEVTDTSAMTRDEQESWAQLLIRLAPKDDKGRPDISRAVAVYNSWGNDTATVLEQQFSDPPVAQELLEIIRKFNPRSMAACYRLASLYSVRGEPDQAKTYIDRGLAMDFSREGFFGRISLQYRFELSLLRVNAMLAEAQGKGNQAADLVKVQDALDEISREFPYFTQDNFTYERLQGWVAMVQKRTGQAQEHLESAYKLLEKAPDPTLVANERLTIALLLSEVYRQTQNYGFAMGLIQKVRQDSPQVRDDPRLRLTEAQIDLALRNYKMAETLSDAVIAVLSKTADGSPPSDFAKRLIDDAMRVKAGALSGQGKTAEAAKLLEIVEGADTPVTTLRKAVTAYNTQDFDQSIALCGQLANRPAEPNASDDDKAKLDAIKWQAVQLEVRCLLYNERKDEARDAVREFLKINPEHKAARVLLTGLEEGQAKAQELALELIKKDETPLGRAFRLARESALNGANKIAQLQSQSGQSVSEAIRTQQEEVLKQTQAEVKGHLDEALEAADASQKAAVHRLGLDMSLRLRDMDQAEAHVKALEASDDDGVGGRTYRGRLQYEKGEFEAAVQTYSRILDDRNADSVSRLWLARCRARTGRPGDSEQVIPTLRRALQSNPLLVPAWRELVGALLQTGLRQDAWAEAENGLARLGSDDYLERVRLERLSEQEPAKAIAILEKKRNDDPKDWRNLLALAAVYQKTRETAKAEEVLLAALDNAPASDRLTVVLQVADFYRHQNDPAKGETMIRQYLQSHADQPIAYQALAEYYKSLTRLQDAADLYLQAIEKARASNQRSGTVPFFYMTLAEIYRQMSKSKEAIDAVLEAQKALVDPSATVQRQLAGYQIDFAQLDEARATIDEFKKRWPEDPTGALLEGRLYLRQGQPEKALAVYDGIIAAHPDMAAAYYLRGMTAYQANPSVNAASAIESITKAVELEPGMLDGPAGLQLAGYYRLNGQQTQALTVYRKILARNPGNHDARLQLIDTLASQGRPLDVDQELADALKRYGDVPAFHIAAGGVAMMRKNYAQAEKYFREALKLMPGNVQFLTNVTNAMAAQNNFSGIVTETADWLKSNDKAPSSDRAAAMAQQALALGKLKRIEEMYSTLEQAVDLAGVNLRTMEQLARLIYTQIGPDDAETWLTRFIDKHTDKLEPQIIRADLRTRNNKLEQGIADMKALLGKFTEPQQQILVHSYLAQVLQNNERYPEAADHYAKTLELADEAKLTPSFIVYNNYAYMLADNLDKADQAIPLAEKAATLANRDANILDTLGWCYVKGGQDQKGIDTLQEGLQKRPMDVIYYHLALTYRKMNQVDNALKACEEGLKAPSQGNETENVYAKKIRQLQEELNKAKTGS